MPQVPGRGPARPGQPDQGWSHSIALCPCPPTRATWKALGAAPVISGRVGRSGSQRPVFRPGAGVTRLAVEAALAALPLATTAPFKSR